MPRSFVTFALETMAPMSTDKPILAALKKGDEQAYKHLFHTYFTDLVLYACRLLKNKENAEDLVQELFISFWYEKKYTYITNDLEGYLYRSLRNSCLNYLRDENNRQTKLSQIPMETKVEPTFSEDFAASEKEREELYRAVGKLPSQCKQIFTLCCLHDMTYQETADHLGVSINTVRTQMGRALKSLRDSLRGKTFAHLLLWILHK